MTAAWIEAGKVSVRRLPAPRLQPGFARIRMTVAGICNTDLELKAGYYGFRGVPGHEFTGVVEACPSAPQWIGKRVVGEINLACGQCGFCAQDLGRHCPKRTVLGIVKHPGAFAESLTLPVANLLEIPATLSDEEAVFTEPVAAACEILEQLSVPFLNPKRFTEPRPRTSPNGPPSTMQEEAELCHLPSPTEPLASASGRRLDRSRLGSPTRWDLIWKQKIDKPTGARPQRSAPSRTNAAEFLTEAAVLGDGKLGLLIAQVLLANGVEVHHFGRHKDKLAISKKRGAVIGKKIPSAKFDIVIDATGSAQGLATAVAMCRPRGTVVMKSTVHDRLAIDMASVIVPEITLMGSRCGRFQPALDLLAKRQIDVLGMLHGEYPLTQAPRAFEGAAERGTLKILLRNQ